LELGFDHPRADVLAVREDDHCVRREAQTQPIIGQ
jgi:hypothetical protein